MTWRAPEPHLIDGATLISTDVFDTLLLRDRASERSRIFAAERRFSQILVERGFTLRADTLAEARLQAKRQAFRALDAGHCGGEVRLIDIVARQLAILGLPANQIPALVTIRTTIEIAQEKAHLRPNPPLVDFLRSQKDLGRRIVAISDTTLSAVQLAALIDHCCAPGLLDEVYSSADEGATKREGTLFTRIAAIEGVEIAQMLHLGDDRRADDAVPRGLGVRTHYGPRSGLHRRLTRAHGGLAEAGRQRRLLRSARDAASRARPVAEPKAFGASVLGPLAAAFALRLWLYMDEAQSSGDTALLFCARGGVGIREVFERLSTRLNLPPIARCDTLLVSRLVAARAAIMTRSPAALEEIGREFKGASFADVARALGEGGTPDLGWQRPFDPAGFFDMLDQTSGGPVHAAIARQNELFHRHLTQVSCGATRIVLCDTGLYGSTQRLLAAGFPHISFETVQFARANYKGHGEEHFPKVAGLMVEQNLYNPLKPETCILRYWQLIESLFEPSAPSVRLFHETDQGTVAANSGDLSFGAVEPERGNALLAGALAYVDALPDQAAGARVLEDAESAWRHLRRAIVYPDRADLNCIGLGPRSTDFGRSDTVLDGIDKDVPVLVRLRSIKQQLWREGAITREFPQFRHVLLPALDSAHVLRALSRPRQA